VVFEVLIEWLKAKDEQFCIGISENVNTNNLNTDELLEIARKLSEPVLAFQFFNSSMIIDELHLLSSAQNAVHAMQGEYMISRGLDVELIVYSSAQHQIGVAIDIMGIKDQLSTLGIVCIDSDEEKVRKCLTEVTSRVGGEVSPMFSPTPEKTISLMGTFNISEEEIKQLIDDDDLASRSRALSKCIVSRVSMVAIGS
jgi:tRNA threonylcarbamoyladenosine modification (KEOPS) complex Cgi121 subunit